MSHTMTMNDRRFSSGEVKAIDDVPPKLTDWWADFGISDRGLIRPSKSPEQRVETSGLFFMKELAEEMKHRPKAMPRVEAPRAQHLPMGPPPVLPAKTTLMAPRRSVWTVPALVGAMLAVAALSALATLWITGGARRPATVTRTVAAVPGQGAPGQASAAAAAQRADRAAPATPARRAPAPRPAAGIVAAPVAAAATGSTVEAPAPVADPVAAPVAGEVRAPARKRSHRGKRSHRSADHGADAKPASASSGYSLYAALGAASAKAAPRAAAPAVPAAVALRGPGVATEATPARAAVAPTSDTYRMLRAAVAPDKPAPAVAPRPALPTRLPASAIARGLRQVSRPVQACLRQFGFGHATLRVRVTVAGATGRVSAARALGRFADTPVGRCAQRSARGLRFPRFSRPAQTVLLPVRGR